MSLVTTPRWSKAIDQSTGRPLELGLGAEDTDRGRPRVSGPGAPLGAAERAVAAVARCSGFGVGLEARALLEGPGQQVEQLLEGPQVPLDPSGQRLLDLVVPGDVHGVDPVHRCGDRAGG